MRLWISVVLLVFDGVERMKSLFFEMCLVFGILVVVLLVMLLFYILDLFV